MRILQTVSINLRNANDHLFLNVDAHFGSHSNLPSCPISEGFDSQDMFHFEKRRKERANAHTSITPMRLAGQRRKWSDTSASSHKQKRKAAFEKSTGRATKPIGKLLRKNQKEEDGNNSDSGVWSSDWQPIWLTLNQKDRTKSVRMNGQNHILPRYGSAGISLSHATGPHKRLTLPPGTPAPSVPSLSAVSMAVGQTHSLSTDSPCLTMRKSKGQGTLSGIYRAENQITGAYNRDACKVSVASHTVEGHSEPFSEYLDVVGEGPAVEPTRKEHIQCPPKWLKPLCKGAHEDLSAEQERDKSEMLPRSHSEDDLPFIAQTTCRLQFGEFHEFQTIPNLSERAAWAHDLMQCGQRFSTQEAMRLQAHRHIYGSSLYLSQLPHLTTRHEVMATSPLAKATDDVSVTKAAVQQAEASSFWKGNKPKQRVSFCFDAPLRSANINFIEKQLNHSVIFRPRFSVSPSSPSASHALAASSHKDMDQQSLDENNSESRLESSSSGFCFKIRDCFNTESLDTLDMEMSEKMGGRRVQRGIDEFEGDPRKENAFRG
ncbi:hypothetical protein K437DRAFT_20335 [Tilletiaria anomala UBC 951]|uniref:Uncharacterized protein n=1 Tax=Tilletiaria anomala (strain ATCC 24038 / CBS 436.72 / UBC 951) TaxID=1037660 RepID=A0A066VJ80_TILAU|nr:uncharacterized protein K437DRAFT_20335 [Tilletiaria anomala UBC 951]KDN38784.1 hypothetical protein K437DRAFT_20335 [Tilletiaria anomala UBC 951]